MAYFSRNETLTDSTCNHIYTGLDASTLSSRIHEELLNNGYTLKEGQVGDAVYEKGNRIVRLLLGAFYKYFKFSVRVESHAEGARLHLFQKSSGMSGGLIGVSQVKTEMKRLAAALQRI